MFKGLFCLYDFAYLIREQYPENSNRKDFFMKLLNSIGISSEYNLNSILIKERELSEKKSVLFFDRSNFDKLKEAFKEMYKDSFTIIKPHTILSLKSIKKPIPFRNTYSKYMKELYESLKEEKRRSYILTTTLIIAIYNDWYINFVLSKEIDEEFIMKFDRGIMRFIRDNILVETGEYLQVLLGMKESVLSELINTVTNERLLSKTIFEYCENHSKSIKTKEKPRCFNINNFIIRLGNFEKYANEIFFIYAIFEYSESETINRIISNYKYYKLEEGIKNLKEKLITIGIEKGSTEFDET